MPDGAIDKDSCFRYALNNRPPVDNWSTHRATLLGDAAHLDQMRARSQIL